MFGLIFLSVAFSKSRASQIEAWEFGEGQQIRSHGIDAKATELPLLDLLRREGVTKVMFRSRSEASVMQPKVQLIQGAGGAQICIFRCDTCIACVVSRLPTSIENVWRHVPEAIVDAHHTELALGRTVVDVSTDNKGAEEAGMRILCRRART